MGGIDGSASAETVRAVFGRCGGVRAGFVAGAAVMGYCAGVSMTRAAAGHAREGAEKGRTPPQQASPTQPQLNLFSFLLTPNPLRFGPIYDYELQPATHEKGRTDQWGFVNYKKISDATRAYEQLVGEVRCSSCVDACRMCVCVGVVRGCTATGTGGCYLHSRLLAD